MTRVSARAQELLDSTSVKVWNPEDFKPGAFGLSVISGPVGRAVWAGQKFLAGDESRFTHAWLILDNEELLEAEPGGARIVSVKEYFDRSDEIVICDKPVQDRLRAVRLRAGDYGLSDDALTDPVAFYGWVETGLRADIVTIGRSFEHAPYGYLQYPYIGLAAHGVRSKLLKRLIGNRRTICSQLIDRVLMHAGHELFADGRWEGEVTPGDLWRYVQLPEGPVR
jgi:hypothetical protein